MRFLPLLILPLIAGCGPTGSTAYRLDGRSIPPDPKLVQQWETDKTICVGEEQKANMSAGFGDSGFAGALARAQAQRDVFSGCMAQRGYRVVWH